MRNNVSSIIFLFCKCHYHEATQRLPTLPFSLPPSLSFSLNLASEDGKMYFQLTRRTFLICHRRPTICIGGTCAVVVAQLEEPTLRMLQNTGSNPVTGYFHRKFAYLKLLKIRQ